MIYKDDNIVLLLIVSLWVVAGMGMAYFIFQEQGFPRHESWNRPRICWADTSIIVAICIIGAPILWCAIYKTCYRTTLAIPPQERA
jgi:hypothetical protein